MKIIDGEIYVNKEDAITAMKKEMDSFSEKGADSEINLCIGLTIMAYMAKLFEKDGEQDEHE